MLILRMPILNSRRRRPLPKQMAFSQGLVGGTDVPVEHLDYDYIGNCKNPSEVEKLLKILRSNQEGYYPKLIEFTEKKLAELNPQSKLLIKTEKARTIKDLSFSDSKVITADLEQWEQEIRGEDTSLNATPDDDQLTNGKEGDLPPIRKAGVINQQQQQQQSQSQGASGSSQRIKSNDFQAWDKYSAEEACEKLDKETLRDSGRTKEDSNTKYNSDLSEREQAMSSAEKKRLALREKEKGNEAFRAGDLQEALAYYSKSIKLDTCAAAYNNRAITYIKLRRFSEAIQDCTSVLQIEPTNAKALMRRGTAFIGVKDWEKAEKDLQCLLEMEPKSKKCQELLDQAKQEMANRKKGRRVQIEEVEEEKPPESPKSVPPATATHPKTTPIVTTPTPAPPPMPLDVLKLKEKGNDLFRKGQYGEAMVHYSNAIKKLEKAGPDHTLSLSTMLNNRAACHLKNGNSQACISDCTQSLQLVPINVKALVRRAQAYEHLEKYRLAYVDNQQALQLDRSMESVYAASSRISQLLKDLDGNKWRERLPPHPDRDRIEEALKSGELGHTKVHTEHPPPVVGTGGTAEGLLASTAEVTSGARPSAPITTTTTSTSNHIQTQVTQSTSPVVTSAPTKPTHPPAEVSKAEEFERSKAKGNEHVKKGDYLKALNCYSLSIAACPDKVVAYTNRALCHLKLNSPSSAEEDCSKALELEPDNIKALFRRARARKALERYADATKDLKQLLKVDPENTAGKTEFAEVKQLWEKQLRELQGKQQQQSQQKGRVFPEQPLDKKQELEQLLAETKSKMNELKREVSEVPGEFLTASKTTYYKDQENTGSQANTKQRRKVKVEEVGEEQTRSHPTTKGKTAPKRTAPSTGAKLSAPFEFVQEWNSISRHASARDYAALLEQIQPAKLPEVITNKLEAPMLTGIVQAISQEFLPQKKYQLCVDILENLAKVPRFNTITMFLGKKEKIDLLGIFDAVEKHGAVSKGTIQNLKRNYGVNT